MNTTVVEGYLTQNKLENILKNETSLIFEQSEFPVPDSKMRFDFLLTDFDTNKKIAVEFNGYQHYTKSSVIQNDCRKKSIAKEHKIQLIEIPYFVQLTNNTFEYYFGRVPQTTIIQDYPHGFIDKKAVLPADFCSLGIERFIKEISNLPEPISEDIQNSLVEKLYLNLMFPTIVFPLCLLEEEIWELYNKAHLRAVNDSIGNCIKEQLKQKNK